MSRHAKLLQRILRGHSDGNVRFEELRALLQTMGFVERVRGSHHIFRHPTVPEWVNLQEEGGYAKRYQVRQIRLILTASGMTALPESDHG